jgi:hypothetical protein
MLINNKAESGAGDSLLYSGGDQENSGLRPAGVKKKKKKELV